MAKRVLSLLLLYIGWCLGVVAAAPTQAFFDTTAQTQFTLSTGDWIPPNLLITLQRDDTAFSTQATITEPNFILDSTHTSRTVSIQPTHPTQLVSPIQLTFDYRLTSTELSPGFDEPALVVQFNDAAIFQDWVTAWPANHDRIDSGWQTITLSLPVATDQQLKFILTNSGDNQFPTQVEIANLTTTKLLLGQSDQLILTTEPGAQVFAGYDVDGELTQVAGFGRLTINAIDLPPHINSIQIWAVDLAGNTTQPQIFSLQLDLNSPSPIIDLVLLHRDQFETIISWTTPLDPTTRIDHYLWRVFDVDNQPIVEEITTSHLPYQLAISKPPRQTDWLVLGDLPSVATRFEIISIDSAGNQGSTNSLTIK